MQIPVTASKKKKKKIIGDSLHGEGLALILKKK